MKFLGVENLFWFYFFTLNGLKVRVGWGRGREVGFDFGREVEDYGEGLREIWVRLRLTFAKPLIRLLLVLTDTVMSTPNFTSFPS